MAELVREIMIDATPETIWPFLTDPDKLVEWHGTEAEIDPRPGGVYRVLVGGQFQSSGEYVEVVPQEKVVFTFGWDQEGHPIPAGSTTIEITLHPEGDKTRVRLVHRGLPDDAISGSRPRLGALPRPAGDRRDRRRRRARQAARRLWGELVTTKRQEDRSMTNHPTGSHDEWLEARLELLKAEKELTRLNDDVARQRRELPWVRLDKDYLFDTEDGEATLADLFHGRSQLLVYHFMYGPDWDEGCPSCSAVADGFDETHLHLQNHDVAFTAVSRAPLEKLLAYRDRMGWSFPWASSGRSDFNFDFNVSFTEESVATGGSYNFRPLEGWQVDPANLPFEGPGMSAFALDDGVVYHTYSAYARGLDALWNMWQWLDRSAARPQRRRSVVVPTPRPVRGQLPVTIAHIAGVPFEEWLAPLAATGSGIAVGLRATLSRVRQRHERHATTIAQPVGVNSRWSRVSPRRMNVGAYR